MREPNDEHGERRLRVGSLFSGYGGLDLAVEQVFDARTVWFSGINEPVARVFAHHWPDAPNDDAGATSPVHVHATCSSVRMIRRDEDVSRPAVAVGAARPRSAIQL